MTSSGTPCSTGATSSTTVIVCDSWLTLPQASVAVQVRVMVYGQPSVADSAKVTTGALSQLSVAVTVGTAGMASQLTVTSAGTPSSTGGVVSSTVTVWVAVVTLPQWSVAVQVRMMV